jgi:hypothetical protein
MSRTTKAQNNMVITTVESKNSNVERSHSANEILSLFALKTGIQDEDTHTKLSDLVSDLMHLCDKEDIDFNDVLERASDHYTNELVSGQD